MQNEKKSSLLEMTLKNQLFILHAADKSYFL